ncbi:hypothetical protein AYO49_03100 [Verrucomicrobiaceae bacterium SCGC AG-212-N21]|nr:hypothetical protein AYO49_03100 [Verrucomicrobiaceae bacterium SCGC AG-212-N21]
MNDPADSPFLPNDPTEAAPSVADTLHAVVNRVEESIRRHPMAAALATLGLGCAVGLAARELLTPATTSKQRALDLLEDIQARLTEFAEPMTERASHLAEDGADAMKRGLHAAADSSLGQRLRSLFS